MSEFNYLYLSLFMCSFLFIQNRDAKLIPDYIHPCKEEDNECLLKSTRDALPEFVKGIPELGVPVLDPFEVDKISIPLNGLKATFYDGKMYGFKKCVVDKIETKLQKRRFYMELHCNATLKGKYEATGRVLLFSINGEGDAKIKITNLKVKINIHFKYMRDDKKLIHYALDNYKHSFDYGDKVTFNLTNLFKGNPEMSSTVLTFINENWRQVAEEFGKPIVDFAVDLAVKTIEKFFHAVPCEELVDGTAHIYE